MNFICYGGCLKKERALAHRYRRLILRQRFACIRDMKIVQKHNTGPGLCEISPAQCADPHSSFYLIDGYLCVCVCVGGGLGLETGRDVGFHEQMKCIGI